VIIASEPTISSGCITGWNGTRKSSMISKIRSTPPVAKAASQGPAVADALLNGRCPLPIPPEKEASNRDQTRSCNAQQEQARQHVVIDRCAVEIADGHAKRLEGVNEHRNPSLESADCEQPQ
jgi:hypothetical protein